MKKLTSLREFWLFIVIAVLALFVQATNHGFLTLNNVRDLAIQISPFAIMACGMTMVLLLGEIDVSIGSIAGLLSAGLGTLVSKSHLGLAPGLSAAIILALGAGLGAINGLLIAWGRLPSIIVTLGSLTILRGVTEVTLNGKWITDLPAEVRNWGTGSVHGVPFPVIVATLIVASTAIVLTATPIGRKIYAIGSDSEAARLRGVSIRGITLTVFTLMGMLTALATLVSVPQLSVVESGFGKGWELFVITCVVVGGVSVRGGRGSLFAAITGVVLLAIVRSVLLFLKLGDEAVYWERAIQGGLILVAVLADRIGVARSKRAIA